MDAANVAGGDGRSRHHVCKARPLDIDAHKVLDIDSYIAIKRPGTAQCYLVATRNKDGNALDGGKTYRLKAPPNVPVRK